MPPGTQPPLILKYNAVERADHPARACRATELTEAQLFDFGNQVIRAQIATIAGAVDPVSVRRRARARSRSTSSRRRCGRRGSSANDVNTAIGNQNLIVPAGTQKIGDTEYNVKLNASPLKIDELNDLPIRTERRRRHLHARRRLRARRPSAADQHRARERPARRAHVDPEDRRGLDARHRQRDQGSPAARRASCCPTGVESRRPATSRCSSRPRSRAS